MNNRVELEREYWDKAAGSKNLRDEFIAGKGLNDETCLSAIRPYLKHHRVLEIGCGIGRLTKLLSAEFGCCYFTGIDISEEMVGIAGTRPRATHIVCDGRTIPITNGYFESAYSMLLFQHLPPEGVKSYLSEAFRVLKPGGIFRFQYVTEAEKGPFSHPVDHLTMSEWAIEAGFRIVSEELSLIKSVWGWMTLEKPGLKELPIRVPAEVVKVKV